MAACLEKPIHRAGVKKTRYSHKYGKNNRAVPALLDQTRIACADDRDPTNRDKNGRLAVECIFVLTYDEKLDFMKAVGKLGSLRSTQVMCASVIKAAKDETV